MLVTKDKHISEPAQQASADSTAPTAAKTTGSYAGNKCPLGVKPKCGKLLDKIGTMLSEKRQELDDAKMALSKMQDYCTTNIKKYNTEITAANLQLKSWT